MKTEQHQCAMAGTEHWFNVPATWVPNLRAQGFEVRELIVRPSTEQIADKLLADALNVIDAGRARRRMEADRALAIGYGQGAGNAASNSTVGTLERYDPSDLEALGKEAGASDARISTKKPVCGICHGYGTVTLSIGIFLPEVCPACGGRG